MADKPFVINDRRRFSSEGELRPDAPKEEPKAAAPAPEPVQEAPKGPQLVTESTALESDVPEPPALTTEQTEQASRAYNATVDRLDTAVRAMNPGGDHLPAMSFERLVQSLYMQALIQLGGAPEPGQPAQVDLMGARATIDMLAIVAEKSKGNLESSEEKLVQSALFELRMGFLEVTQALARQAQQQRGGEGASGMPGRPQPTGGPSIVR